MHAVGHQSYSLEAGRLLRKGITAALSPALYLASKVALCAKLFFGYLQNTIVFSFGLWQHSYIRRVIIPLVKGGCSDTQGRAPFDIERLNRAKETFTALGAKPLDITTENGLHIDAMQISCSDIERIITQNGGSILRNVYVTDFELTKGKPGEAKSFNATQTDQIGNATKKIDLIVENTSDPNWQKSHALWKKFHGALDNVKFDRVTIKTSTGEIKEGYLIQAVAPQTPDHQRGLVFVRCNSPTEAAAMTKGEVIPQALALKGTLLFGDYPGTMYSEGVPSEGSYYLFAQSMVKKAYAIAGNDTKKVWAIGFCLGGSVATSLKKAFPKINLLLQNTFCCLLDTNGEQKPHWISQILSPIAVDQVKSWDWKIRRLTVQTGFNNVKTLESVGKDCGKAGHCIVIHGTPDTTIPESSHERIVNAAKSCFETVTGVTFSYCEQHQEPEHHCKINAHSKNVIREWPVWGKVTEVLGQCYPVSSHTASPWPQLPSISRVSHAFSQVASYCQTLRRRVVSCIPTATLRI